MDKLECFAEYLQKQGKSQNTINGYVLDMRQYLKWFMESFGKECTELYRQNVFEYKSFLLNIRNQNAKTVNHKLSSLSKYNQYLIAENIQQNLVITKDDMVSVQLDYASPTKVTESDIKGFIQGILETKNKRDYAIVVLLAYAGLRISEALAVKLADLNLPAGELLIRNGKGEKQRTVILNSKVINAVKEYQLKERDSYKSAGDSPYLFVSKKRGQLDRTVVNRIFKKYNQGHKEITPHQLRHFFCTNAIEKGFSIHEVASQAGHSSVNTTLLYTNPDKLKLKKKMELL